MNKHNPKIVLGMSGGVDSSVCAYLLKKQGYDVIGLFMQNWDSYANNDILGHTKNDDKQCNVHKDFGDAKKVADKLGIPLYRVEFINKYWNRVFKYTIDEYKKGRTPNPDVLCNKYIKFDEFLKVAKTKFGCDQIAMGHYASTKVVDGTKYLCKAKDEYKDQTYFLCWLNQKQIDRVVFPIGNLEKTKVREIAKDQGLDNWSKKDSTGICFIGERKFKDFLSNYIKDARGEVVDVLTNQTIGSHDGVMFYTIGQNRGLNLGGQSNKYFVCKKDVKNNVLFVVDEKHKDKLLNSKECELIKFNWINQIIPSNKRINVRFRHRQKLIKAKIKSIVGSTIRVAYGSTLSVTPGQFAVFYQGNICLGGGIVNKLFN